jgi:hypothetical protein
MLTPEVQILSPQGTVRGHKDRVKHTVTFYTDLSLGFKVSRLNRTGVRHWPGRSKPHWARENVRTDFIRVIID